jgi:chromosome condensin MukBEF MukE localization factor
MGFISGILGGIGAGLKKVEDVASDVYHSATGTPTADERRFQQKMIREQVKAYKDQTELAKEEIARKRGEQDVEKRKINEKQIRSLRRTTRTHGILNATENPQNDMSSKLGG